MKIVAELGVNTNGDLDTALRMVEAAAEAGVDGVKVQAYDCADFLPPGHPDWAMFEDNRLSWLAIERVQDETLALGMEFGATPTSLEGIERLAEMKVDWLKNGSDFLLRTDLIEAMLDTGLATWVSTGMADEAEWAWLIPTRARVMACTSVYPCPDEDARLARLHHHGVSGYSDHTRSALTATVCKVLGAQMYETHFTLHHDMVGPDHTFSRNPAEMATIVRCVKEAEVLLGGARYGPTPEELTARDKWRVTKDTLRA